MSLPCVPREYLDIDVRASFIELVNLNLDLLFEVNYPARVKPVSKLLTVDIIDEASCFGSIEVVLPAMLVLVDLLGNCARKHSLDKEDIDTVVDKSRISFA